MLASPKNATFAAMKRLFPIGFLLFVVLVAACSKQVTPPLPEEDMLYRVECFLKQKPDDAMQILDTLNVSVLSDKEQAHYSLLRALLINNKKRFGAELDSLSQVACNQFIGSDDKYHEAWTYWLMANKSANMQQPKQIALESMLQAHKSIEACRHVDKRLVELSPKPTDEQTVIDNLKYFIYLELGMTYTSSVYFAEAIPPLRLADAYFAKMGDEFDSCLVYFQKALLEAEALGYADDIAQTHHSIASYYNYRVSGNCYASEEERQGFLDKAIEEINAGFACLTDTSDYGYGYVKQLLLEELSDTYYIKQQYDSCVYYGEQAIEVAKANDRFFENYMLYVHLYEACKALGDEKKAVAYADMMQAMEHPEKHMKDMVKVQEEFEKQEELQQQETLHQQKSRRLYWLLALLLVGMLLLVVFVYFYRRNKENETRRLREAQRQLQAELEQLTTQQRDMLQQQVIAIYQSGQKDRMQRIVEAFEAAYPQGIEKMKSAYPDLSKTERNLVVLSFLGFRIKEEADILDLSENTVMKYRSKLKNKADFDPISALLD